MRFDPAQALQYARLIARPRLAGTPASDAIIDDLASQLRSFGCAVQLTEFEFSSLSEQAPALPIVAGLIVITLTFWAWSLSAWAAVAPALSLAVLIFGAGRLYRLAARASLGPPDPARGTRLQRWWQARGRRLHTANVIARVPARAGSAPGPGMLLVAHSDSKSQALPLVARMALIGIASLAALTFAALTVARVVLPLATSAAAVAGVIGLVAGVPLLFLYLTGSGNSSPGAIDNASGAGLVVHLAECLCADPPSIPVTVLITGAEELGLLGALAFARDMDPKDLQGARVLNFDGIGTAGPLALVGEANSGLATALRAACRELHIPLGRWPLIGAQYDHLPFAEAGLEALSLVTAGAAVLSVHTRDDDVSKLDVDGFRRAGQVALRVLEKLS